MPSDLSFSERWFLDDSCKGVSASFHLFGTGARYDSGEAQVRALVFRPTGPTFFQSYLTELGVANTTFFSHW